MGLIIVTAVHSKTAFCIRRAKMKVFERKDKRMIMI